MRSEQEVNRAIGRYADTVFRLCMVSLKNSADAEDVFQTVFLKYALSNQRFETPEHEKAWLIRVTVSTCRDLLKSFFRQHTVSLEEIPESPSPASARQTEVLEAVRSLPKDYREVIYLHYYEGYTAKEIAELWGKSPQSVRTRLTRARKKLKKILGEEQTYEHERLQTDA